LGIALLTPTYNSRWSAGGWDERNESQPTQKAGQLVLSRS